MCASLAEAKAGMPMLSENGRINWLLLNIMFFIDAYESAPSRTKDSIAIYMRFANASTDELNQANSWKLVCIVPQGDTAFFLNVLREVVVKPMLDLEHACMIYFRAWDHEIKCYGSIFAFIGDHPGLAEIMRMTSLIII